MTTARDELRQLAATPRGTPEQENDLRQRARAAISAACHEQYKENSSVFTPEYCLSCEGCPLGTIVKTLSRS